MLKFVKKVISDLIEEQASDALVPVHASSASDDITEALTIQQSTVAGDASLREELVETLVPVQSVTASSASNETTEGLASQHSSVITTCYQILSRCEANSPPSQPKPCYVGEIQQGMLVAYLQAALQPFEAMLPTETKSQYDAKVRASIHQKNTIKRQYIEQFSSLVCCDDAGEPMIFQLITQELKQIERDNKIRCIHGLLQYPVEALQALQPLELQRLFLKTEQVRQRLDAATNVLEYLCERAQLPKNTVRIILQSRPVSASSSRATPDPLQYLSCTLVGTNEAIGYSIHNMLVIAGIRPNEPFAGNASQRFEDESHFQLNVDEFKVLQEYLGDLSVWYRDFENILSALFGSDASIYVKTGCKPLREAVITEVVRERSRDTLFMRRDVRTRFSQHEEKPFLLFGQAAIDLTAYPQAVEMRTLLTDIYRQYDLKDSKREPKTFVKDEHDRLTFVSLLSIGHIRQIYNEIMALATLTKTAKECGFTTLFDYISVYGAGDPKGLYYQYLQELLNEIVMTITSVDRGEDITNKRRRVERLISNELRAPSAGEGFSDMQLRFQHCIKTILNQKTDIRCRLVEESTQRMPTRAEKIALLSASGRIGDGDIQIPTTAQLDHTVRMFKASPNYALLTSAYEAYFQSLGAQPILPASRSYSRGSIYMHSTLDACIDKLISEFKRREVSDELNYAKQAWFSIVTKVVYARKMHIPTKALERAATRFGDIFKIDDGRDDLGAGCNTGLAGRCLLIDTQLISANDDPLLQLNKQLLIDELEQSFNDTLGSIHASESSMAARIKPMIMSLVGLQVSQRRVSGYDQDVSRCLTELSARYTPGFIYSELYQHMCDAFKRCIREEDHAEMEVMLTSLGYSVEVDSEQLQIDGKWNIKLFESFLPTRLITLLCDKHILSLGSGQLVIEESGRNYSFVAAIEEKQRRLQRPTSHVSSTFFTPAPVRAPAASASAASASAASASAASASAASASAASASSRTPSAAVQQSQSSIRPSLWMGGSLYPTPQAPTRTVNTSAPVDLRGASKMASAPDTGSLG